ncbi:predicted protein [Sclerotinia sclerotiorum 1980 UF-70]|uniref:Uncharacterized protein n=1 Tax=Sclerotinia sclerotiorum (strain ATCC 18683 / 1980 / Ss-1) TaxID=665079 RepID=A7E4G2_SCLS1|nr:predicted protein [Sclerotinia sclerotiorum 1980 UF-70]EDN90784.1 predicted protein [Sclerotinia sclerotiorum 1980 UF-70]
MSSMQGFLAALFVYFVRWLTMRTGRTCKASDARIQFIA